MVSLVAVPDSGALVRAVGTESAAEQTAAVGPVLGAPPGFVSPAGTLPMRAAVTMTHSSLDELAANAASPGVSTNCTAWLVLSAWRGGGIRIDLLRLETPGAAAQVFTIPMLIAEQRLPLDGIGEVREGAILLDATVVTVRLAGWLLPTRVALLPEPANGILVTRTLVGSRPIVVVSAGESTFCSRERA